MHIASCCLPGAYHELQQPHRHHVPPRPPSHTRQGKRETDGVLVTRPAWVGKGSRHDRGYGAQWDKLRKQVLKRDNYLCQECLREGRLTPLGVRPRDHAVDHIEAKAKGGTDAMTNLQSLCAPCHDRKTARDEGRRVRRVMGADGWPLG